MSSTQIPTRAPHIATSTEGSVLILRLDHPDRSVNIVDEHMLDDLADLMERAWADPAVEAVVLASGKSGSFGAGADVGWLPVLAARQDAAVYLAEVHDLMGRLRRSAKPVVAAVDGFALGGALELALGAQQIVVGPTASLGLPEVTLGLIPGGAGTQLVLGHLDANTAVDLVVSGRPITGVQALAAGLAGTSSSAEDLLATAVELARSLIGTPPVADVDRSSEIVAHVRSRRAELSPPQGSAVAELLDVLEVGAEQGFEAGCAAERAAFLRLLVSPDSLALRHLFLAEGALKRAGGGGGAPVTSLGVVGAGQMGAALTATAVSRGLPTVVRDVDADRITWAGAYRDKVLSRKGDRAADLAALWTGTTEWDGFDTVDAIVEAVFELPELKKQTLAAAAALASDDTLITTNTSAIPIATLAPAVPRPERFMGTHFFSPVDRMPLVELIPHSGTSAETVRRAEGLARRLGKVPVVVADVPGFFTSRVYARWLMEGVRLLLEGVDVERVDRCAKAAGFPVGPLQAHDEATLDLVVKASITQVAEPVMADRLPVAEIRTALERLVEAGVRSRREGAGFYRYLDGRRAGSNRVVSQVLGAPATDLTDRDISDRLLFAFATECFLCWDEKILCHPDDGDVASVLGIGFPRALGGPFHWADAQGATTVVARCAELGVAFPSGARLAEFAASGGTFAAEMRVAAPGTGA